MKHILGAAALSIACASASAALINQPAEQLVPIFKGGVDVGVTGGWFEPLYHHIGLVVRDDSGINSGQPDGKIKDIDSDYCFSYGGYIGWRFACSGNDVRLNFFEINVDSTKSASKSGVSTYPILWTVVGQIDDDYIDKAQSARGKMEYEMQRWDFEFAQHINFCSRANLRFFFGASYHCVEKERTINYVGDESTGDAGKRIGAKLRSCFDGYGPRVGLDFDYAFDYGFGILTHLSTAMLYGDLESTTRIARTDISGEKTRVSMDRCIIVPNFDLKIGVDYSYCFTNCSVGRVELGWWVNTYINAVNDTHFVEDQNDANHINRLDNVSFNGFYLTLAYSM